MKHKDVKLTHIVACTTSGIIGSDGKIPWHNTADFKHFKETTMGGVLVMGRKTFESLPGVLRGRVHFVITRDPDFMDKVRASYPDPSAQMLVSVFNDIDTCLMQAKARAITLSQDQVFIVGGGEIYERTLHLVDCAIVTLIPFEDEDGSVGIGDAWYPLDDLMDTVRRTSMDTHFLKDGGGAIVLDVKLAGGLIGKNYQHYKSGRYQIVARCRHADTNVDYITYKSTTTGETWTLPYGEFFKEVPGELGLMEPRFFELDWSSHVNQRPQSF